MEVSVVILKGRPLYIKQLVTHNRVNASMPRPVLRCTYSVDVRPVLRCTDLLAAGGTRPALPYRGAHRQLPPRTCDYATCMALPLLNSAARRSHANVVSV